MLSAAWRKSVTDLTRRRARTFFVVLTLAIAVSSVSFLAIPTLIDRAMQDEVEAGRLADVTLRLRSVELDDEHLAALASLPNVDGVEARSGVDVRVLVGRRRAPALIVGVRDFPRQEVDLVRVESGDTPGEGELLADVQDANVGVYDGSTGDEITVLTDDGRRTFRISGRGRSLPGGELVQDENIVVLYAPAATVAELSGDAGIGELALRLDDPTADRARTTVDEVRATLGAVPGFDGFADLPQIRAPGDWPGKSDTEAFGKFLAVITVLALLSAAVLISNTMGTLVAEQTREIAVMRAVGARRRQVAQVYLRTTLLLGAIATVVGVALGVVLSSLLAKSFGQTFWAVDVAFGVDATVLAVSAVVGVLAPPIAALPAIRRGLRVDLREGLEASGSALGEQGPVDRWLRRATFLPSSMQIGLRNTGRRKRQSLATASIVALAVANLLAVMALAAAATSATETAWGDHLEDVQVSSGGKQLLDDRAERAVLATPGVVEAEPVLKNEARLDGHEAYIWAVEQQPLFRFRLTDGRWFAPDESRRRDRVAIVERNVAQIAGIDVGDEITLATAAGDARFEVVGIANNQQEDGTAIYIPLTTGREVLRQPAGATAFWIRTDSREPSVVDGAVARVEDQLAALGFEVSSEVTHVAKRDEVAANRSLTTSIAVLGFVIVAISMVGLANAITTNVLERTREIGVLRSVGARARDVRRIFTTEGVALTVFGWVLGIPLGYGLMRLLVRLVWEVADVRLPAVFPPWNVLTALVGTLLIAVVVLALPVRRAVRFRPGDALRHT